MALTFYSAVMEPLYCFCSVCAFDGNPFLLFWKSQAEKEKRERASSDGRRREFWLANKAWRREATNPEDGLLTKSSLFHRCGD